MDSDLRRNGAKPKRLTQQQITGPLAVNLVERVLLTMGFPWHPTRQELEGGIDGFVEIRDPATGDLTNCFLKVQVRGTSRVWVHESKDDFSYRCNERDLQYWMQGDTTPVILIVVRPEGDEAYWVNIREVFVNRQSPSDQYVRFNKSAQRFDQSAKRALMRLAVPKDVGTSLPAMAANETLVSNLLHLKSFPSSIYVAPTEYRTGGEIFDQLTVPQSWLPGGWALHDKTIRCFHNLREEPWRRFCDHGAVDRFDSEEWAYSTDAQRQREFVRLLNHALRSDMRMRRLWWSKNDRCYFFPPRFRNGEPQSREYRYRSAQHLTTSEVVMIQRNSTSDGVYYWRHDAFKPAFLMCDGRWHMAISPHYVFTSDGRASHPRSDELISGLKRVEHQRAVLGQVLMWRHMLTRMDPLFEVHSAHQQMVLIFDELLKASSAKGIVDRDWLPLDERDNTNSNTEDTAQPALAESETLFKC
jgi:hypothetical protein